MSLLFDTVKRIDFLIVLSALIIADTAMAMDVKCIEESKYKYLHQIFGGDARKFAAYFEIDTSKQKLPDPEACRAAHIFGGVGERGEYDRVLDFIVRNKGWLAAIYLSSGGGGTQDGMRLGYLVRAFRLKTYTARNIGNKMMYEPDFGLPPLPSAASVPGTPAPASRGRAPQCSLAEHAPVARNARGLVSGLVRPETFAPSYEEGVDREGPAYRQVNLSGADPRLCQKACGEDGRCRAWTYRKPDGKPNSRASCELKERVLGIKKDANVVSGLANADAVDATFEENSSREGPAYREFNVSAADPRLCQKACLDELRCRSWGYRKPEGRMDRKPHCWLKEEMQPQQKSDNLNISGAVLRLQYTEPTLELASDRGGGSYRDFNVSSADPKLCQKACVDEARCRAWAYRKPEGRTDGRPHCWLKDTVQPQKVGDNLLVSGMVFRGPFEPSYDQDTERPGVAYRSVDLPLPDPLACKKNCVDDGKCRAWTYTPPDSVFQTSLMTGWEAYRATQRGLVSMQGNDWCASACTFLHVAGVDRTGVIQVHRANQGWTQMSQQAENLQHWEAAIVAFYRYMDSGPAVVRQFLATSATTVSATRTSRFPRYYNDYLIANCRGSDPERLQNLETQLEVMIRELDRPGAGVSLKIDHLRASLAKLHEQRRHMEQCVARAHERERLAAFDKICGKGCDPKQIAKEFDEALDKATKPK